MGGRLGAGAASWSALFPFLGWLGENHVMGLVAEQQAENDSQARQGVELETSRWAPSAPFLMMLFQSILSLQNTISTS